ncbi:MAG: ParB N-terminal domain-containing protein [Planctomycetales bacterium]|nr:ParB N-terminal domain-containing protein [Planctomycetales bacterium]
MAKKKAAKKTASNTPKKRVAKKSTRRSAGPSLDHIAKPLRGLAVELTGLVDDPRNARTHDETNMNAIRASLARFGQLKPIVVQASSGMIAAGHGTVAAAKSLGWTHVAANVCELSDEEARNYGLADNRTAELAEWDLAVLQDLAVEIKESDELLFDELLLADLIKATGPTASPDPHDAGDDDGSNSAATYQVVVDCDGAAQQQEVHAMLAAAGYESHVLTTGG